MRRYAVTAVIFINGDDDDTPNVIIEGIDGLLEKMMDGVDEEWEIEAQIVEVEELEKETEASESL